MGKPLTPDVFLHLIHQLLMEITPGNLVDDIKLICPQYAKKIMYISKNKQTGLQDFGTLPLGSRCDLVLNTIFCKQNKSKLIFYHLKQTFLFPFQLPNSKYRTIIVNTKEDTITCYTTKHCMLQPEKNQAQTIMQALDKNNASPRQKHTNPKINMGRKQSFWKNKNYICKLKNSVKKVGSLTSQCENDTGFIMYYIIQNFVLGKTVYPTVDIPLLCKQVAVQLTLDKYIEFTPIYEPIED